MSTFASMIITVILMFLFLSLPGTFRPGGSTYVTDDQTMEYLIKGDR